MHSVKFSQKFEFIRTYFIISAVLILLYSSCKKTNNSFRQVTFSGSIKESPAMAGIANVPIRMYWYNSSTSGETAVDSTITDAQGNYTIKANIDMSNFNDKCLNTSAKVPNDYVSTLDIEHNEVGQSTFGIQSDNVHLITMYLNRKALLTIHLKRTSNDIINQFELYYNFKGTSDRYYWVIYHNIIPTGNMTFNVITAAGISTTVYWSKITSTGSTLNLKDSITCLPGAGNMITLNY